MKLYKFTAIFTPEGKKSNIYNVSVPALPGCFSFGESLTEARYNIREAIELYLLTLLEDGEIIPQDKKFKIPKNSKAEEIVVGVDFEIRTGFANKFSLVHA